MPASGDFSGPFEAVGEEGAVVITLASTLSGTYQSACIATAECGNIYVIDSGSVAIGTGIPVELALTPAQVGLTAKEIGKAGGVDFDRPVLLGYTGLSDALLIKYMEDSAALWAHSREMLCYTLIGSAIGTHVGPGAVAAAFFAKENS